MAVPEDRPIARCSEKAQIGDPTHFMIFGIRIGSRFALDGSFLEPQSQCCRCLRPSGTKPVFVSPRTCFLCKSADHISSDCPQKTVVAWCDSMDFRSTATGSCQKSRMSSGCRGRLFSLLSEYDYYHHHRHHHHTAITAATPAFTTTTTTASTTTTTTTTTGSSTTETTTTSTTTR